MKKTKSKACNALKALIDKNRVKLRTGKWVERGDKENRLEREVGTVAIGEKTLLT